nr:MAG TPA: putative tail component [Caudoviricetes sp.]
MKTINPEDLAAAIMDELQTYDQKVTDGIKKEIRQVAKECRQDIVEHSPVDTGEYKSGWKDKVKYEDASNIRITVYNKKDPYLTHLLEHGHAGPGGIAKGSARPFPHIAPAEQRAEEKLMRKVKVVVKRA